MNKLKLILAGLLLASLPAGAQVAFRQISLDEAIEAAKAEQKPIFMDCQTKWCGSCKVMAREIFSKPEVGDFFNARFVNVLMDMETPEGKEVNKRFGVRAYPTFFIITPEGKLQHRIVGARLEDRFMELVRMGMKPETSLQHLDSLYKAGRLAPGQAEPYVVGLNNASMDAEVRDVALALFAGLADAERVKASNWYLYANTEMLYPCDEMFAFLVSHKDEFAQAVGDSVVNQKLSGVFQATLRENTPKEPLKGWIDASYEAMPAQVAAVDFPDKPLVALWLRYNTATRRQDTATLFDIWENHLGELPYMTQVQIPFGFDFILNSGDKEMLRRYIAVGERLLPYMKTDGLKQAVKEKFDQYKAKL